MKVVWRQKGKQWEIAAGRPYTKETHLQELLEQNPALIPFEDISKEILPPAVMIREAGLPGSGSSDIVGIDEGGGITIVECKLATNPEIKRTVVGQVLEYAAFLWQKSYPFLDDIAQRRLGKPLAWAVKDCLEEESREEWNEASFIDSTSETLRSGSFRLIIAVDALNDELRRTIEYLAQGPSKLTIYALEVSYYTSDQGEILVPHLYGMTPQEGSRVGPKWNRDRFFADAQARHLPDAVVGSMHTLLDFSDAEASRVFWGVGKQTGSFTFHCLKDTQTRSLFSVYSDGKMTINFGWLKMVLSQEVLSTYLADLQKVEGLRKMQVKADFNCWPAVKIAEVFKTADDMAKFQEAVVTFRDRIADA